MTETILVTGGTGTLGRAVVERLVDAGHDVRVLSRRPPGADEVRRHASVTGDLSTAAGVGDAVAGVTVIIHCATTNGRGDVEAAQNLIAAAQRGGQPHLIYISIVGVDEVPLRYYRAKLEVEELVAGSGLPWTVLRATQFHDLVTRVFAAQHFTPLVVVPAGISVQPIDVREVADRLTGLAGEPAAGRVPDIGGPQVRALTDLARAFLRANGRWPILMPLPLAGKVARAYRRGGHLTPERAVGTITYEQFLDENVTPGGRVGARARKRGKG
ncbi:MAG: NmrA family transcriptional regulator [Pseudonocardiales bacterium]|nr:MAG: NmrA family transcriptional regulator [Pseudonocardiales bacterium]